MTHGFVSGWIDRVDHVPRRVTLVGYGDLLVPDPGLLDWLAPGMHVDVLYERGPNAARVVSAVRVTTGAPWNMRRRTAQQYLAVIERARPDAWAALKDSVWARCRNEFVRLIEDRRMAERRQASRSLPVERRSSQRRAVPPATWHAQGFLLVARAAGSGRVARQ